MTMGYSTTAWLQQVFIEWLVKEKHVCVTGAQFFSRGKILVLVDGVFARKA